MQQTSFLQVIIWLTDGKTLLFRHVTNWKSDASIVQFDYEGQSTHVKSHMQMDKGWYRAIAKSVED